MVTTWQDVRTYPYRVISVQTECGMIDPKLHTLHNGRDIPHAPAGVPAVSEEDLMDGGTIPSGLPLLFDRAIGRGDRRAHESLSTIAEDDTHALEWVRQRLLGQLRSRRSSGHEIHRAAELLTTLEAIRRSHTTRKIAEQRLQFTGLRALCAGLRKVPRSERAVAVTSLICGDLGFGKCLYSAVSGEAWSPITIAVNTRFGDTFRDLRRAVDGLASNRYVIPRGAAPREEALLRLRQGVVVDRADTYRDTYRPLIDLSRPSGYVAVPIVASGQVTGILHADRHDIAIDTTDLNVLRTVAQICGLLEEQELLRTTIADRNRRIRDEINAIQMTIDGFERTKITLAEVLETELPAAPADGGLLETLTGRERRVFELAAAGTSSSEISRTLSIAQATVKSHLRAIYRKLGVSTRAEAAVMYRRSIRHADGETHLR